MVIYALGNAACSFYEKRLDLSATAEAMEFVRRENALYLESITEQKLIAEQVLLHVVLAGESATDKTDLLAALRELNFSDSSLESLENDLDSLKSLPELLLLLDEEFGVYVSSQSRQIAQLNGEINRDKADVLEVIERYFDR